MIRLASAVGLTSNIAAHVASGWGRLQLSMFCRLYVAVVFGHAVLLSFAFGICMAFVGSTAVLWTRAVGLYMFQYLQHCR